MSTIKSKAKKLKQVERTLIKQFVGCDKQIKQILNSIRAWYFFPESLTKPLIINCWGITGTFKTTLLRAIIQELGLNDTFVEVDSRDLQGGLKSLIGHPNLDKVDIVLPNVFLLDEFQNCRTIDRRGDDTERADGLAELFSFLSDGQIKEHRQHYKVEMVRYYNNLIINNTPELISEIEKFYADRHAPISKNKPTSVALAELGDILDEEEAKFGKVPFISKALYFFNYQIGDFEELLGKDFKTQAFKSKEDVLIKIHIIIKNYGPTRTFDLSKSLVFVAGNIDEAFRGLTQVTDNDYISPDEFYDLASKVNFNNIKQALFERFKPEQVSRLGSNHIIFPSFNTAMYKSFISSLNKRSVKKFNSLKIKIKIDKSVDEFILKHFAIPSQGARSVLSAHEYLVDSNLSEILAETMLKDGKEVLVGIVDNRVHLINDKKKIIKKNIDIIDLKVLGNYENEDLNHTISVHEASHAIVATALLGQVPSMIKVRMNDSSIGGYCKIDGLPDLLNRRDYINMIAIALAGYCGELIDKNEDIDRVSTGSYSDIMKATAIASELVKVLGLGNSGTIVKTGFSPMFPDVTVVESNKQMEKEVEDIVNEGFFLAFNVLEAYSKEHKELTEVLKKNVTVKADKIAHIFKRS